ncbi:MAG: UDP-N-acetylmuramate dehydrogenase [Chitinophagaceae bacterium]
MNFPILQKSFSLKNFNTFGIESIADSFLEISEVKQLEVFSKLSQNPRPWRVLGGGSNVLLEKFTSGTVLKNSIRGITLLEENRDSVIVRVGSGENWHEFVMYAVKQGWGGIENLALIPGTVGAAPIQNIGAYGVEVKDTITEMEVWIWDENRLVTFENAACDFGYRDSIFKNKLKGRFYVCSITFKLSKAPKLHTDYGAIKDELTSMQCDPSIANIAQAVINIRKSKLPDPKVIGNAGSFFKNPTIASSHYKELKEKFPSIPGFSTQEDTLIKVPAAWLIEQCGWKGFRRGNVGVHDRQALVLVNVGGAIGTEIWELSQEILSSVEAKFDILLEREVQTW